MLVRGHKAYLEKRNGMRAEKWDSLHSAISEKTLEPYKDRWDIAERNLR